MYRVLITGDIHPNGLKKLEQERDIEIQFSPDLPYEDVLRIIQPFHCILSRSETRVNKEMIEAAPELKVIARAGVGVGNIDVEYATERGILVINTPGKNTNSAAELTMGLLLSAFRKIVPAHQSMQSLNWDRHRFNGGELLNKCLGIIGLGNVGHRVARYAKAFDMKVQAFDPYLADEVFERHGVQKVDWITLLNTSDVITFHVPLNDETRGMISEMEIERMKPGVILLNTARGGVIHETSMLNALHSGHVAAAGIDTWEVEPPRDNPFSQLPQVVMSPHIGASTSEAQIRIAESIATQVPRALRGEVVDFPVNMPSVKVLPTSPVRHYTTLVEKMGMFSSQFLDFQPNQLEIKYRGSLAKWDTSLLRLCFLKGFLQAAHDHASYVNADQLAESVGLHVAEDTDPGFTDYESAFKCCFKLKGKQFTIGGVVFSGPHPRITLINDFVCELEASGTMLVTTNSDKPGMIGVIGVCLGKHQININQFELGRNVRGGEAMAVISVDQDISKDILDELISNDGIISVRKIVL